MVVFPRDAPYSGSNVLPRRRWRTTTDGTRAGDYPLEETYCPSDVTCVCEDADQSAVDVPFARADEWADVRDREERGACDVGLGVGPGD